MADESELLDYEEEEQENQEATADGLGGGAVGLGGIVGGMKSTNGALAGAVGGAAGGADATSSALKGSSYVSIHSSGFKDFLLKPELLRAIMDCGFEHPSEVQHECIPQANLGMDILCQAKSGMGKTAVFVLSTLQQLDTSEDDDKVRVLVLCHTRELAFQISKEYERFSKYMKNVRVAVFFGGMPIQKDQEKLKQTKPNIVVGTPGRIQALIRDRSLSLQNVKHFTVDECDKMLSQLDMRKDLQDIFKHTPHQKQVMMFSATLAKEVRPVCRKFMQDPLEVFVDDDTKLTLHGLQQHYLKLTEKEKNRKLTEILDVLEFNQVIIFVKSVTRCLGLSQLLLDQNFPAIAIHSGMTQDERLSRYSQFKNFEKRILVATDLFGRGIDIERVNIVINYDMPPDSDTYLHRVARAGRFGTKGLAITFIADESNNIGELSVARDRGRDSMDERPTAILAKTVKGYGILRKSLLIYCLLAVFMRSATAFTVPSENQRQNLITADSAADYGGKTQHSLLFDEDDDDEHEEAHHLSIRTPYISDVGHEHFASNFSLFLACVGLPNTSATDCTTLPCAEDNQPEKPIGVACKGPVHKEKSCFSRAGYVECSIDPSNLWTSFQKKIYLAPVNRMAIWGQNLSLICGDVDRAVESPPTLIRSSATNVRYSFLCIQSSRKIIGLGCDFGSAWDFRNSQCVKEDAAKPLPPLQRVVATSAPMHAKKKPNL